jgi:hypothetical protein
MSHPTITNDVARLRSEEKIARGLAAYMTGSDVHDAASRSTRFARRRRIWQWLSLSLGGALVDAADRRPAN